MTKAHAARIDREMTRAAVAAALDMSERHLHRLETGESPMREWHLLALARLYNCDPDDLREEVAA